MPDQLYVPHATGAVAALVFIRPYWLCSLISRRYSIAYRRDNVIRKSDSLVDWPYKAFIITPEM